MSTEWYNFVTKCVHANFQELLVTLNKLILTVQIVNNPTHNRVLKIWG